jgi:hypothetical protein
MHDERSLAEHDKEVTPTGGDSFHARDKAVTKSMVGAVIYAARAL